MLRQFVDSGARSVVYGGFLSQFRGVFVDNPIFMMAAENKLLQLHHARAAGLRVPKTIVTNRLDAISSFARAEHLDEVIAKPLGFAKEALVKVRRYTLDELYAPEIETFPTLVQEFIEGTEHLRVVVLGREIFAFAMNSDVTDWRFERPEQASLIELPSELKDALRTLLVGLKLSMGIVDMKRTSDDEYIFFEVNPQGQFLFLEAIAQFPLAEKFCDFLVKTAES